MAVLIRGSGGGETIIAPPFADASWKFIDQVAQSGKAPKCWSVGDTKDVTLSTGETITLRIEDFQHDMLTSGGKAGISLIMLNCLNKPRRMNASSTSVGGWEATELRTWLHGTFKSCLPPDLQAVIKSVDKLTNPGGSPGALITISDDIWLPSYIEVNIFYNNNITPTNEGTAYPLFVDDASRIKKINGSILSWWLRSPSPASATSYGHVHNTGTWSYDPTCEYGVAAGICI